MGFEKGHVEDTHVLSIGGTVIQKDDQRYAKHDIMRVKRHAIDISMLCCRCKKEKRGSWLKLVWLGGLVCFPRGRSKQDISYTIPAGTDP